MKKLLFLTIALCFTASFAQFENDEWSGFDYEHAGLSQAEFQMVKESNISKKKLMHLLEIGIRPSEYLKEPWKNLGVSEEKWLSEREVGMDDSDIDQTYIDRTYKNQTGNRNLAYLSFLLPSLYQWSSDEIAKAIAMNVAEAASIGMTVFWALNDEGDENTWIYGAVLIAAVHVWSGIDAIFSTQWDNNPDARNFSWGIIPTGKKGFAAAASFNF